MSKHYVPHAHQARFHKSDARYRTAIAGRQSGKTTAGTLEAVVYALQNPKSLGWVVAPTYGHLVDVNIQQCLSGCQSLQLLSTTRWKIV